jgi:hypothetical protein
VETTATTKDLLDKARAEAKILHESIEQGVAQGERQMQTTLAQASASARELATRLRSQAQAADTATKAKLQEAASHAEAAAQHGQSGRARPMLDETHKISQSISQALAGVRAQMQTGAKGNG